MGSSGSGALAGIRVIELAGLGPGPHAAMILADLGAEVVRVERPEVSGSLGRDVSHDLVLRHRRRVKADLKDDGDRELAIGLIERADVLIEGFRPGVTERLGLGPDVCLQRNPRLIYARMTGWGQTGPLANHVGHDINYIARSGVLASIGRRGAPPTPPLNLVGDYGGGSMLIVTGILAALLERESSGAGQVVDAAMVDGAVLLSQEFLSMHADGTWTDGPGTSLLNGGVPYYDTYECRDGKFLAVGAIEPAFYRDFLAGLGLDPVDYPQEATDRFDEYRADWSAVLRTKDRDEWAAHFEGYDACVAPVLTFTEAAADPQVRARGSLTRVGGVLQATPAPQFSRSTNRSPAPPEEVTENLAAVAESWKGPAGETATASGIHRRR